MSDLNDLYVSDQPALSQLSRLLRLCLGSRKETKETWKKERFVLEYVAETRSEGNPAASAKLLSSDTSLRELTKAYKSFRGPPSI